MTPLQPVQLLDPYRDFTDGQVMELVARAESSSMARWDTLRRHRDIRYGYDNVMATIPMSMRTTNYEYHSGILDRQVSALTSYLAGGRMLLRAMPGDDADRRTADEQESVFTEIFNPFSGVLDQEATGSPSLLAWEHVVEDGEAYFKLQLKRDSVTAIPQRIFSDDAEDAERLGFERNPDGKSPSRRRQAPAEARQQQRFRETDETLYARHAFMLEHDFPWRRRVIEPRTIFVKDRDGQVIGQGEISLRSADILDRHGLGSLRKDHAWAAVSQGQARDGMSQQGSSEAQVMTFEFWSPTRWWFGFMTNLRGNDGLRTVKLSATQDLSTGEHYYGRVPYFGAFGVPSTDDNPAYTWSGAFPETVNELGLLNRLETMAFNAEHRGLFPKYQLVPEGNKQPPPLDTRQTTVANHEEVRSLPPPAGYVWAIIPPGNEVDIDRHRAEVRQRIEQSAVAQLLTGAGIGSGDSGAKVSLVLNSAREALSPFVRNMEACWSGQASMMADVSKRLRLDLKATTQVKRADGKMLVRPMSIKGRDIVTSAVQVGFVVRLPVDQAALESRGLALLQNGAKSYQTIAPEYFNVADPIAETERMDFEKRIPQLDEIAFREAIRIWAGLRMDAEVTDFLNQIPAPAGRAGTLGGGPGGAFGGASQALGRGDAALASGPGSAQAV